MILIFMKAKCLIFMLIQYTMGGHPTWKWEAG